AEARLAARRQARAEAREIRMRELERQQKEQELNADRVFDLQNISGGNIVIDTHSTNSPRLIYGGLLTANRASASRRSSEDSLEDDGKSFRDLKNELKVSSISEICYPVNHFKLKDSEERFRKAMITNAQLENDRASKAFEVKLLRDKCEIIQESYVQLQREFKEKLRDCNMIKRNLDRATIELNLIQGQLNERDLLISEQGLIIVAIENSDGSDAKRALVSVENANVLASVQGSLDERLKKFSTEKQKLLSEVHMLHQQLDEHKSGAMVRTGFTHGAEEDYETQRESNKIIADYKYKLNKSEQEVANLQSSLARSESQVIRYKSTTEAAEKVEAELKIERRKLQREHREILERLEEAETANNHLLKRLDKLKNAKSAILKDL
ncbi:hypothetical protein KR074_011773, partial [Drosophila pseudoananassae]